MLGGGSVGSLGGQFALKLGEFWLTQLLKVSQSNLNPSLEIQLQT
jgi:hypothetical protein